MPDLKTIFEKIDSLREQLEKLKPFKREDEERLWKKFRLEWNYNSNHIEGNTLTYGQTELLIIFEKTTGDHDMREYEEMKAHDVAMRMVTDYAKDSSREITEADIREINKIILVRPFWNNAQTPDGQPTRKLITPGEYKKEPNSVLLQNGEMFHYASPEDTPAMMKELLGWYSDAVKQKKLHPVEIAALIHYKFVRIHPFDDSNGRTSRLLMNYVLLRFGYPPVIIKSADKKNYLNALNKADVGDVNAFVEYVTKQLVWSLEISVKAAEGESIEELDDVDKEIDIWKKSTINQPKETKVKSFEIISNLYNQNIKQLFTEFIDRNQRINEMFAVRRLWIQGEFGERFNDEISQESDWISFIDKKTMEVLQGTNFTLQHNRNDSLSINLSYEGFRNDLTKNIFINSVIKIELYPFYYQISYNGNGQIKNTYSDFLSKNEIATLCTKFLKILFEEIKNSTKG